MPKPDFGIRGIVAPGRNGVIRAARRVINSLDNLAETSTSENLESGYQLLIDVRNDILSIGSSFQGSGLTLLNSIISLANSNGQVSNGFTQVYNAIGALDLLVKSGLNTKLRRLVENGVPYIAQQFRNSFAELRKVLRELRNDLQKLQSEVEAAAAEHNDSGAIPSNIVRRHVLTKTQNDVRNDVTNIHSATSAVRFVVQNTLTQLHEADEFLQDIVRKAKREFTEYEEHDLKHFENHVEQLAQSTLSHISEEYGELATSELSAYNQLLPRLRPITGFSDAAPSFDSLLDSYSPAIVSTTQSYYNVTLTFYIGNALNVEEGVEGFFKDNLCKLIRETIRVLIGSKSSDFCFSRISPRVFKLFDQYYYSASQCFRSEKARIRTLLKIVEILAESLLFNLEDLVENLTVCAEMCTDADVCLRRQAGFYDELGGLLLQGYDIIRHLVEHELAASIQRLTACVQATRFTTLHDIHEISHQLRSCDKHGHMHVHRETVLNGCFYYRFWKKMKNPIYGCCYCWVVTILALGYLQGIQGSPRPDFGIDGAINGAVRVIAIAGQTNVTFEDIKPDNITLTTNYTRLYTLRTALSTIATRIATDGQSVTTALETLANSTGSLPIVFNDTLTAVTALQTQLLSGLAPQRTTIQNAVGPAINLMLTDAGKRLQGTLTRLNNQLGSLNASITTAVLVSGSSTIAPEVIRNYVTPVQMAAFKRTLHEFQTDLPLFDHIITLTLKHLQMADTYLSSYMTQAMMAANDALGHYAAFKLNVEPLTMPVENYIFNELTKYRYDELPDIYYLSDLQADTYMKAVLDQFDIAYDDVRISDLSLNFTESFTDYLKKVVVLDDYLDRFFDSQLCEPVRAVLQVLIASGPWAEYCFHKYWPKLDVLLQNAVDDYTKCYQIEEIRLERIFAIVPRLVDQLVYDFQYWADHTATCYDLYLTYADCFKSIGPAYKELALLAVAKQQDLLDLTILETTASYNRIGACFATAKYDLVLSAEKIVSAVAKCETSGPNV
ncbi:hypothetical protein AND_009521 [Anopheles darlingi]|uniref:Uncharacterized protein n=1 Tax=Anopheles darlingi TaxID=43151 RepID=W5J4L7_ANODA|nr:hypothetical protein AND_009521 [Anopheles darlingi]